MDDLLCPTCRIALARIQTSSRVIWRCEKCDGRVVGLSVLRAIFTAESINPIWLHAIHDEGRVGRPCPSCAHAMIDVPLATDINISVEVCRLCQLVWFDKGEVAALTARPPKHEMEALPQEAREAIAIAKVHALAEEADSAESYRTRSEFWRAILVLLLDL